ncbi:MAG: carboxypeptidase-like regulatory domain-containing protein [Candidatus Acidiferrum sp.]
MNSRNLTSRAGSTLQGISLLAGTVLLCISPVCAQVLHSSLTVPGERELPDAPIAHVSSGQQQANGQRDPGTITGALVDQNGTGVVNAHIQLSRDGQPLGKAAVSDEDGHYFLSDVSPGPFVLTVAVEGFAAQSFSGTLRPGENYSVPQISLSLATNVTEVRVELSTIEIAQEQMKDEVKQRVLGVFPNFYITYIPNAAPLSSKQKFQLAWKETLDPVNFIIVGATAGVEQARDQFTGYGQGAEGYGKRFGAAYGDLIIGTFIGSAILPSLLKQDPRYFYKGTGTVKERAFYAIANSVICKGDNGKWQFNYSQVGGSLIAGSISNLYYPSNDRNGAALTVENTLIGIGGSAVANLFQEFVLKRFTSHVPSGPTQTTTP